MEARVVSLEQAVQELRRLATPTAARRGERQYLALLRDYLSEDEARELAFRVAVDWETLPGESKRGRLLSLVQELERRGRLYQFEAMVREIRPHVDWPPFV